MTTQYRRVDGEKTLYLTNPAYQKLLTTPMIKGNFEFYFKLGGNFNVINGRALVETDGARLLFFVKDNLLIFMKNRKTNTIPFPLISQT